MRVLWETAPLPSKAIVEQLETAMAWKPTTVKTLLSRLVKKGAVLVDSGQREYQYSPAFTEQQCVRGESRTFLGKVYSGSLVPLVAGFLEDERLSREEIQQLRELLDSAEKKQEEK